MSLEEERARLTTERDAAVAEARVLRSALEEIDGLTTSDSADIQAVVTKALAAVSGGGRG